MRQPWRDPPLAGTAGRVVVAFCPIIAQLNAGPPPLSPAFSPMKPDMC
jgi:hypothetical protein